MCNTETTDTSIPKWFSGKVIFITGGTGFMGKVLIEKLLRSCPDVAAVYVLTRAKKGKSVQERLQSLTENPVFQVLKKVHPENMRKIIPIEGDVTKIGLNLSPESRRLLINEVNIIYHAAATVRFDEPLKDAVLMNTRGTREVVHLAKEMKNLQVLVHVSTTYCHTDKQVVEEKLYPPIMDWRQAIQAAETVEPHILNILAPHYMDPMPNTYTFSKGLSENLVRDLCEGTIPTIIFRPSIVISSVKEPLPGWIDNFNGPVGILIASGKGILRSMYTNPNITADYIPVDVVIKGLIISTWRKGLEKDEEERKKLEVYNASNNKVNNVTLREMIDIGKGISHKYPLNNILWHPQGKITNCYYDHFIKLVFLHLLPAILVDSILKLTGNKPMLLKIQRKIYIANMALHYFVTQEWTFINDKSATLEDILLLEDQATFKYGRFDVSVYDYFVNAILGARQYLLKEPNDTLEQAKVHSKRMYVAYLVTNTLAYAGMFYLLFFKIDIIGILGSILDRAYLYLSRL